MLLQLKKVWAVQDRFLLEEDSIKINYINKNTIWISPYIFQWCRILNENVVIFKWKLKHWQYTTEKNMNMIIRIS
jgi:hypothetical protein